MLIVCIRDRNEVYILNDDPHSNECLREMANRKFEKIPLITKGAK